MKKCIALLLALLCALGVYAPALAYTQNTGSKAGESPYTLDLYLVEYTEGDRLANWLSMPPTDRGYAKNEIIAAIGALTVPANHSVWSDYFQMLEFSAENMSLHVVENKPRRTLQNNLMYELNSNMSASVPGWTDGAWQDKSNVDTGSSMQHLLWAESAEAAPNGASIVPIGALPSAIHVTSAIPVSSAEKTYRFLVFGKVLDDGASLTFTMRRQTEFVLSEYWVGLGGLGVPRWADTHLNITPTLPGNASMSPFLELVLSEELLVSMHSPNSFPLGGNIYYIFENSLHSLAFQVSNSMVVHGKDMNAAGRMLFAIEVGEKDKTGRLYMYPDDAGPGKTEYRVHVEPSTQELLFIITKNPPPGKMVGDQIKYGTPGYSRLLALYKEVFEEGLGLSAYNEGNFLPQEYWYELAATAPRISATLEISPWVPYVSAPENIVTDPHKPALLQ